MSNISDKLIKPKNPPQTTLMTLRQCSDNKVAFNALAKLEQSLTITESINTYPVIQSQGTKVEIVKEIIRIIEFFLTATGREMETYQIQILAGDLYEKMRGDTLEDIVMMFQMARRGEFGKVYKVDNFEVMEWREKYIEIKAAEREKMHRQRKKTEEKEVKEGKYFHELPQELQEKFKSIGKPKFLPPKAIAELEKQRFINDSSEVKKNPVKFKRYV